MKNLINAPKTPIVDSFLAKTPSVLVVRLNGGEVAVDMTGF